MSGSVVEMPVGADILQAGDHVALVNPVDCTGAMGAGLAKKFAKLRPTPCAEYRTHARAGGMTPGQLWFARGDARWIIFAATKGHYSKPSQLEWIQLCVDNLVREVLARGIKAVAVPALGCGEKTGRLDWTDVRPLIFAAGKRLATKSVRVLIYPPHVERHRR